MLNGKLIETYYLILYIAEQYYLTPVKGRPN